MDSMRRTDKKRKDQKKGLTKRRELCIIYLLAMANRCCVIERTSPIGRGKTGRSVMNLRQAEEGKEYIIQAIETDDEELDAFLFSLGCYSGEPITVVSRRRGSCVVSIKDGRYNFDANLCNAIEIK